jgi:hypothetical protein
MPRNEYGSRDQEHTFATLVHDCGYWKQVQSHGVEVHAVEEISAARSLWQPKIYDLVMLDVRRYSPGETLEFYEEIKDRSPRQCIAFLVGAPTYLSLTWPGGVIAEGASSGQWGETVNRFLAAA